MVWITDTWVGKLYQFSESSSSVTSPLQTVFVGDSEVDIATARAADLPCISVLWGFRDRDVLERAGAQQFAADAGELARLLD